MTIKTKPAYGQQCYQAALEVVRQDVLKAGFANGGMEAASEVYHEIAWQVREKALEEAAEVADGWDFGTRIAKEIRELIE